MPSSMAREGSGSFWQRLSTGEKLLSVIALLTLIAASLVVPEVRYFTGLEKRPPENVATPPEKVSPDRKSSPLEQHVPEDQETPRLKYIHSKSAPSKTPGGVLVTSIPKDGEKGQTVTLNGEKVEILKQEDVEKLLADKGTSEQTFKWNPEAGKIDLFLSIDKDGGVEKVQRLAGDKSVADQAAEAVKEWKFKPFFHDGQKVG